MTERYEDCQLCWWGYESSGTHALREMLAVLEKHPLIIEESRP